MLDEFATSAMKQDESAQHIEGPAQPDYEMQDVALGGVALFGSFCVRADDDEVDIFTGRT